MLVGAAIALVAVANRWSARESLQKVTVIGVKVLDTAEVLKQAGIPEDATIRKLNLKEIEERVLAHPFIVMAAAYYGGDGQLMIEIDERSPVAATVIGSTPVYLDTRAVVLPFRFGVAAPDVPVLSGLVVEEKLDSVKALEAIGVATSLQRHGEMLYRRISEIRRDEAGEYTLFLTDNAVPVIAGRPEEIVPRLPKLEAFLNTVLAQEGAGKAMSIDLRWDGQVVVRWKDERTSA